MSLASKPPVLAVSYEPQHKSWRCSSHDMPIKFWTETPLIFPFKQLSNITHISESEVLKTFLQIAWEKSNRS